jgi:6-phosphogluconate dehydrogenase
MGGNMARRLMRAGHECVAFDLDAGHVASLAKEGATGTASIEAFVQALTPPRAAWVMVPAGEPTEHTVRALSAVLDRGDAIIDGGNSYFKDDVRRAHLLASKGIDYIDVGTSGGVWGAERGYCLMIGGPAAPVARLTPIFRTLAPGTGAVAPTEAMDLSKTTAHEGFIYCGPSGAGHFVKMIHNGIEYGLMQAYAEGFDIMRNASSDELPEDYRYEFDLAAIAEVWRRGSVVSSWLLDLAARALVQDPGLTSFTGRVGDSGEGRWTVQAAIDEAVPAEVLTAALYTRFRSRRDHTFAEKLLSALRAQFGGHVEPPR